MILTCPFNFHISVSIQKQKNSYKTNTIGKTNKQTNSFQSCAWSKQQEASENAWVWLFSDPSAVANSSRKIAHTQNTSLNISKAFSSSTLQGNHLLLHRERGIMWSIPAVRRYHIPTGPGCSTQISIRLFCSRANSMTHFL